MMFNIRYVALSCVFSANFLVANSLEAAFNGGGAAAPASGGGSSGGEGGSSGGGGSTGGSPSTPPPRPRGSSSGSTSQLHKPLELVKPIYVTRSGGAEHPFVRPTERASPITTVFTPRPLPPRIEPRKSIKPVDRASLFFTRHERKSKRAPFYEQVVFEPTDKIDDKVLSLDNTVREKLNDVYAISYEYQFDQLQVGISQELYDIDNKLYVKKLLPEQTYQESRTRLLKSQAKAEESKSRLAEYQMEATLAQKQLLKAKGHVISLSEMAHDYVSLWFHRVEKVKAAKMQAQADFDYLKLSHGMIKSLVASKAATKTELIIVQRDLNQATVVMGLANALLEKNEQNYKAALQHEAKVREQEGHSQGDSVGA